MAACWVNPALVSRTAAACQAHPELSCDAVINMVVGRLAVEGAYIESMEQRWGFE